MSFLHVIRIIVEVIFAVLIIGTLAYSTEIGKRAVRSDASTGVGQGIVIGMLGFLVALVWALAGTAAWFIL